MTRSLRFVIGHKYLCIFDTDRNVNVTVESNFIMKYLRPLELIMHFK